MKTKLLLSALLSFYFCLLSSQVPLGFNYQALARDGSGTILANLSLPVKIDIQTSTGTVIYEELFSTVTSNQFGLISLVVGTGVWQSGSAPSFSAIDWKAQPLYLKTIIQYPGTTWTTMGTSQIWAVPYSLTAKEVTGPLTKLGITGTTTDMEEALFEVKNQAGNTVFAVYNEGIRAYVGNGDAKGKKGGFAVGGYDATKGSSTIYNLLTINTDSARLYFDSNPGFKGKKGGFSVGGYDMTKDGTSVQNYLDVTPATTKIFTTDTVKGFSVGNVSTGIAESYLKLTPSNYFIGHEAGSKITLGKYNSVMGFKAGSSMTEGTANDITGYQAGTNLTTGSQNSIIGYLSGMMTTNGYNNVFLGFRTGYHNSGNLGGGEASANIFIGPDAGYNNITGSENTFIGLMAGYSATTTWRNTFVGFQAGNKTNANYNTLIGCQTGSDLGATAVGNTFIGYHAGVTTNNGTYNVCVGMKAGGATDDAGQNELGNSNVYIGAYAGHKHEGNNNVIIGQGAGGQVIDKYTPITGSGNVFIGYSAGYYELGSNKLYIDNSNTSSPLIYGDFTNGSEKVVFNGKVGINTMSPSCYFNTSSTIGSAVGDASELENFTITTGNVANLRLYAYRRAAGPDWRDVAYRIQHNVDGIDMAYIEFNASNSGRDMALGTNNIERIRIDNNGNVGIGTTAPANKLDVNGCIRSTAYDTPTSGVGIEMGYIAASNSGFIQCLDRNTTTYKDLRIGGNTLPQGDNLWTLGASATRWKSVWSVNGTIQTSDIRLKTNISALNYGLESIMKLNPISFNWKDEPGGSKHLGLVAQEVIGIIDEAVDTGTDPDKILGINYSQLVPVLIKGMQEQQQQIESQKKENRQLKSELQAMKERLDRIEGMMATK